MYLRKILRTQQSMRKKAQILNRNSAGFTLIELVVAFSVMAILATVGMAAFLNFSRAQTLQQATNDLITTLNTAKEKAVAQVKPNDCQNKVLNGYDVLLAVGVYKLQAICNGSAEDVSTTLLPNDGSVKFDISSMTLPMTIKFYVITGGVTSSGATDNNGNINIILNSVSGTNAKTITVTPGGVIQ